MLLEKATAKGFPARIWWEVLYMGIKVEELNKSDEVQYVPQKFNSAEVFDHSQF